LKSAPASFRTVRGITAVGAVADEIAFWRSDDSANPDREILKALRPSLATKFGVSDMTESGLRPLGMLNELAAELGAAAPGAHLRRLWRRAAPISPLAEFGEDVTPGAFLASRARSRSPVE